MKCTGMAVQRIVLARQEIVLDCKGHSYVKSGVGIVSIRHALVRHSQDQLRESMVRVEHGVATRRSGIAMCCFT